MSSAAAVDVIAMDTSDEHNVLDKSISTSISSCNELTSSSKRVLLDTSVDLVDLKKIKLFDNNDEKQVNESHDNLIIKETPDQISETTENDSEEHLNVSNKMRTDSNSEKNNSTYDKDSNICNTVHNIGVDNLKTNSEQNINEQDEFISGDDSSDSNSFKSFDLEFTKNIDQEFVQNNSIIYENKPLTDNLGTVDKSDHVKENINENSLLTEISSNDENAKDLEEIVSIENKKTDDIHLTELSTYQNDIQNGTENADDIKIIKCDDKNDEDHNGDEVVKKIDNDYINNGNDVGTIENDNTSNIEDNVKIDDILKCCNELTKANFPILIKIFSKKNVEFEHFENTCSKIISLYMSKKIKEKINVKMNEILDIQKYWHNKYISLSQQMKDLTDCLKLLKEKMEIDSNAKPHQRTVGIQVDMFKADKKHWPRVSKAEKPSQKTQNTFINNIVNPANDGVNYTNNNVDDVNVTAINDVDNCTINNNVEHMINSNNVQHGISNNNVKRIFDNNPIVISDDDDDGDNENSVTLKTQPSTLNTMKNITSIQQLQESNTNEESSEFLTTTILNFQNLPEISLSSINRHSDIIDLTEDDDYDESNNENRAVLQNRTAIDQNLYTQSVIPSGQRLLYTEKLTTAQLTPNNSGQHQQQSSSALQNVPTKCIKFITPTNGTKNFIHIRTPLNCPQQFLELSAPPNCPQQYVMPNATPSDPQQYVMPNVFPSGPQQYVQSNTRKTGPNLRSNVTQIRQPSVSAAIAQLPPSTQIRRTLRSSRPIHPAPLPVTKNRRSHGSWKKLPSAPIMHVPSRVVADGFIIKWDLNMSSNTAEIRSYQFYIYDEARSPTKPTSETWVEIGEVKALPLPMACSFSLLKPSTRYYISMRAVDVYGRFSPFCAPKPLIFY